MILDIRTLIFILGITHVLQFAVFLQQYAANRRVRATGWWLLWSSAELAASACLFLLWRSAELLAPGVNPDMFAPTALNIAVYLDAIVAGLAWTFGLVLLANQRLGAEAGEAIKELELVFDTCPDSVAISRMKDGLIERVSSGLTAITGYAREEVKGKTVGDINLWVNPEERGRFVAELQERGAVADFEACFRRKDGSQLTGLVSAGLITLKDEPYIITVMRDISGRKLDEAERAELKEKLLQSQKMETVGRLAGGVAHDFNNLLTAINGNAGFLLKELPGKGHMRAEVEDILAAAARAAKLTGQLLAFSRKQILKPRVIDLNASVGGVVKMLRRLIGENVRIETRMPERACPVRVDPGQMDQVLINLAVNARDAMPDGGTFTLETRLVTPDERFSRSHPNLPPGQLVCLLVRDTGCGFTTEAREHLFEPFFTTKQLGKGTGMGLSTVLGIVKQSGGEIELESPRAGGTTFRIYFPYIEAPIQAIEDKDKAADTPSRGTETILLAEDEESLRRLGERMLRLNGYTVISAADGESALAAAERNGRPVDLLLTDVMMPGMSGRELAREMARRGLASRTLYMSGYTDDAIAEHGVLQPGIAFIYKPFTVDALALKLREVLDGPADRAEA